MAVDGAARYSSAAQFGQALASGSMSTPTDTASLPQTIVSAAKSVAMLPFTNMSADADNEYFTDGMAEEIINALNKVQSLRVAARTSSFAFKGKNEDVGEIHPRGADIDHRLVLAPATTPGGVPLFHPRK